MENKAIFHLFYTHNHYYIYDLNINSIVEIDESTYKEVNEYRKTGKQTESIKKLKNMGILIPRNDYHMIHPADDTLEFSLKRNLKTMALQVTQNCNLRCSYCVYSGAYSNRLHTNKEMSEEVAFKAIDFFLQKSIDTDYLNLGFYGGEPLIKFDLIKKCISYAKENSVKPIAFNMTTNATLLSEEKLKYLLQNEVSLTISLDGPKEVHDERRVYVSNKGTYDDIYNILKIIRDKFSNYQHLVKFNAVINTYHGFKSISDFFCDDELMKDFPVLINYQSPDNTEEAIELNEVFLEEYNYEFFKILMEQLGKLEEGHTSKLLFPPFVQIKENVHDRLKKKTVNMVNDHPSGPCVIGKHRLFVDVNGNLFPCERVSESSTVMNIGNIYNGFNLNKVRNLLNIGNLTEEHCRNCWAFRFCSVCAVKADDNGILSKKKKILHCQDIRNDADNMLKNYCLLREFNYDFEKGVFN